MASSNHPLPSKESALFKTILKHYEHKQYKKGLKVTDQILKKFPNHGETLAMKGLFCSHLDRRQEAHDLIKKGLMFDLKSHICWHVYGLLHRSEKNYDEAIKCYSHALKYDKDNLQIIRDFALLQVQTRNYEAFNETRHQLLKLRPGLKMHWMGLAVSYHLLQQYDAAEKILDSWQDSMKDTPEGKALDFDNSELHLYKNMIIEDSGDYERALSHLGSIHSKVLDKTAWKEARARILLQLGRKEEAAGEYRELFSENPDNVFYLDSLKTCLGLNQSSPETLVKLKGLYEELLAEYPRSQLVTRMPLQYLTGVELEDFLRYLLVKQLRKGVPSLFSSLKRFISEPEKCALVEKMALELYENLKTTQSFDKSGAAKEAPTSLLWTLYFLTKLYDDKKEYETALKYVNEALQQSPTVVELLMAKARIYKHAGDTGLAMQYMNEARLLDLQDRFVNSKCVKYMLNNNAVKEAEETISLFTKNENNADPLADLIEMQSLWFANAHGAAHARLGNYGKALKRFHQVDKHFIDFYDDQFDFHSYCMRKMTLRAYVALIKTEDQLKGHPFFVKAATSAVHTYLYLSENPDAASGKKLDIENLENMSPEERKKAIRKAKKAALKSQNEALTTTTESNKGEGTDANKSKDTDPDGLKLLEAVDFLEEATKFVKPLNDLSPGFLEGWVLASRVYLKKKKYLLALRAVKKAKALAPEDADVHLELSRLVLAYHSIPQNDLDPVVSEILKTELASLFKDKSIPAREGLDKINRQFFKAHAQDVKVAVSVAQVVLELNASNKAEALKLLQESLSSSSKDSKTFIAAHTLIAKQIKDADAAKAFKDACAKRFPLSTYFK